MRKSGIIIILSFLVLFGCKTEELETVSSEDLQETAGSNTTENPDVMKGVLRVKLSPDIGDQFTVRSESGQLRSGQSGMDEFLQQVGAKKMTRVFPPAGKYEERTKKEGLHLWYDITFDETIPVTRAVSDAHSIPGVEIVEEVYRPVLPPVKTFEADFTSTKAGDENPFNDPRLTDQWHYYNRGTTSKSVERADANLFDAWEKETGKPFVIVSIVDGGLDVNHEDLKDNLYVNMAELNGVDGVDDDNNGYIDDIHGFDFYGMQGTIAPDNVGHGTHVGGTVGARNNNGVGVCGVAGGDGSPGSGARLMSCQVIQGGGGTFANTGAAIKYGADNGAVISQNSWGYIYPGPSSIPASDKAAIDYFIKYAGCDNDGNQLPDSPMKGGVVIFAAGNDDKDYVCYPAAYPPVISVSAMAPDFKKAWYTNRGDWITLMAPGGDEFYPKGMVLSTYPNNRYTYMQGTSMACPHVSGIAALVVSRFGGKGFTNEDLKKQITTAFLPVDINAMNPSYAGRLGKGFIDADKALSVNQSKSPLPVKEVTVVTDYISFNLSWFAVADEDDKTASVYKLFYSDTETLDANNYRNAKTAEISGIAYNPGEMVTYTLAQLTDDTGYSCAIIAEDRWGLQSPPFFFSATTKKNLPPELSITGDREIRITGTETAEVKIIVNEPDGQEWTFTVEGQKTGVTITQEEEGIHLILKAFAPVGKYTLTITVVDILKASSSIDISFEVYKNNPPELIKEFTKTYVPITNNNYNINLGEYFNDIDGHAITYEARSLDPSILGVSLNGDKLTLNPSNTGPVSIEISASDTQNATTRTTFQFQIVKDALVYLMYPIPVTDILNVRVSDEVENGVITIRTTTGNRVFTQNITATTPGQRLVQLNLAGLSGGTYVLHLEANGKSYKQPFVKQ